MPAQDIKKKMQRQVGRLRIPFEVLGDALNLQYEHRIIDVFVNEKDRATRTLSIVIEGPTMLIDEPGYEMICIPSIPKNEEH